VLSTRPGRPRGEGVKPGDRVTRGDPESPLRWTCKSVRRLAEELQHEGRTVSYQTAELLHALDYSL